MSLPDTLELGKHAASVLTSYGVGVLGIGGLIVQSLVAGRRARRELEAEEARRNG